MKFKCTEHKDNYTTKLLVNVIETLQRWEDSLINNRLLNSLNCDWIYYKGQVDMLRMCLDELGAFLKDELNKKENIKKVRQY